jgi:alkylation response protein AidB-like acyl-CoA dehydrogenase
MAAATGRVAGPVSGAGGAWPDFVADWYGGPRVVHQARRIVEEGVMEFRFTPAQDRFRQEVQDFLATELPKLPARDDGESASHSRPFSKLLAARGWIGLAWPKEYGGQELGHIERTIVTEEMVTHRAPTGYHFIGERQMGPSLMRQGTEEQKRDFLPKIVNADVSFCIGMSEPGAGSDLAGVQTRAVRDGDEYVVNGQKIWTSGAHLSDWVWLVCRTDPDAPKHRGISILLVDLKSPGITIRPLINMGGQHGFNEVFYDNVRVPVKNLVGEENRGWYVVAENLDYERSGIERIAGTGGLFRDLLAHLRASGDRASTAVRHALADRAIEYEVGRMLAYRVAWLLSAGRVPNYEASMSKAYGSEWTQRVARTGMSLVASAGLMGTPEERALRAKIEQAYLSTVSATIAGGTSEIQRNIIATRGLGLPRS